MTKEARSLAAALTLTPEVEKFIEGDKNPSLTASKPVHPEKKNVAKDTDPDQVRERREKLRAQRARRQAGEGTSPTQAPPLTQARVAITTRFKQEIAESLRRVSLQRKLKGLTPHSQQEIIETAVAMWLKSESNRRQAKSVDVS